MSDRRFRHLLRFLGALICFEIAAASVSAQPLPPLPPPTLDPPPSFEASAQASLLATTGNASAQSLGFGGDLIGRADAWIVAAKGSFAQTRDRGQLAARSTGALVRVENIRSPRLNVFAQDEYLRDTFAGIGQRHTLHAGLSYLTLDRPTAKLRVDAGLGYQHETRLVADNTNSTIAQGGYNFRWKISNNSELIEDLHATLPFGNPDEWKIDHSASLSASINSRFSLKVQSIVRFVNAPVPGFQKTDTITSVALVMKINRR